MPLPLVPAPPLVPMAALAPLPALHPLVPLPAMHPVAPRPLPAGVPIAPYMKSAQAFNVGFPPFLSMMMPLLVLPKLLEDPGRVIAGFTLRPLLQGNQFSQVSAAPSSMPPHATSLSAAVRGRLVLPSTQRPRRLSLHHPCPRAGSPLLCSHARRCCVGATVDARHAPERRGPQGARPGHTRHGITNSAIHASSERGRAGNPAQEHFRELQE